MGNDGDYVVMCRAVLLMESAIHGACRLWLASHALKYCQTNLAKIGKADKPSLLSVVKLYEEQRRNGLLILIWFAAIVGCDYSSMPNVGPVHFCKAASDMVLNLGSNLSSLIDILMPKTKLSEIECQKNVTNLPTNKIMSQLYL